MEIENEINILLIEDNLADVRLTQEGLKDAKLHNELFVCNDGIEALNFLRNHGKFKLSPKPDLILLDLELPKMSGQEFLQEIKKDDALQSIPVVILTISEADDDNYSNNNNLANCIMTKPINFKDFFNVIQTCGNFCIKIVKFPNVV